MARLTTPTYRDVLCDDLKEDLGEYFQDNLTKLRCLAKTKSGKKRQCKDNIKEDKVFQVQKILDQYVTYLEGDRERILARISELSNLLVHPDKHKGNGREKVRQLGEKYHETMKRHLDAKRREGSAVAVTERAQMPEGRLVEEDSISITQSSCTEMTTDTEIEEPEVTYPALPTTHTFVIEDKEEVTVDSSNAPRPLLQSNTTQSRPLTHPSTPLPSTTVVQSDSQPVSNTLPPNPLLLLVLSLLPQWLVGFISLVHIKWGSVPVRNTSGKTENQTVVDLGIMLGLRVTPRMIPILLAVLGGLYYTGWGVFGSLVSCVLVSAAGSALMRRISPGDEIVV